MRQAQTFKLYVAYLTAHQLWDTWYSAAENMVFVVKNLNKRFVGAIKDNRKLALLSPDGSGSEKLKIAHRMNHFALSTKFASRP